MFHWLSTTDISNFFELDTYGRTRGHLLKLKKGRVSTDLRRHFFTERVVKIWNSLADGVVQSQSLNSFKSSLQREYNKDKSGHRLDACCPIDFRGWSSTGEASIR